MFHSTVAYEEIKAVFDFLSPDIQQSVLGEERRKKVLAARLTGIGNLESSKNRWDSLLEKHQNPTWPNLFDLDNIACETYGVEAFTLY